MYRILFVCLGNICRSPMAEFVFRDMVKKAGLEDRVEIASAATSTWELGNPPHHGTQAELKKHGISCAGKRAVLLKPADYDRYDLILGMDYENMRDMDRIFGGDPSGKVHLLKEYSTGGEVDDPWYTGDYATTYRDVSEACGNLLEQLKKQI
ncbi:MAG: low molecular weight phosphotyrosine protein phosphatase [Anaerolineaceae bacterium]|nr:low molecular weight phosphotyrosine protein phosphatase [Anaerolineaceae bacterium]